MKKIYILTCTLWNDPITGESLCGEHIIGGSFDVVKEYRDEFGRIYVIQHDGVRINIPAKWAHNPSN